MDLLVSKRSGERVRLASHLLVASEVVRSATGRFDAQIMGEKIYERPFEVVVTPAEKLPAERV